MRCLLPPISLRLGEAKAQGCWLTAACCRGDGFLKPRALLWLRPTAHLASPWALALSSEVGASRNQKDSGNAPAAAFTVKSYISDLAFLSASTERGRLTYLFVVILEAVVSLPNFQSRVMSLLMTSERPLCQDLPLPRDTC